MHGRWIIRDQDGNKKSVTCKENEKGTVTFLWGLVFVSPQYDRIKLAVSRVSNVYPK